MEHRRWQSFRHRLGTARRTCSCCAEGSRLSRQHSKELAARASRRNPHHAEPASRLGLHLTTALASTHSHAALRAGPAFSFRRAAAVCAEERPTSQAEIPSDSVLDCGEFVAFEVVHRVTDEVVRVDAADLVDEEPGLLSVDLH